MPSLVPYNEYCVHKSRHVSLGDKVNSPRRDPAKPFYYIPDVYGRKNHQYSQNEIYGSQYVGDSFGRTYLPDIPQRAKNKRMDKMRSKHKTETDQYGNFYSPREDYTGRRNYDIDSQFLPPENPRFDQRYQVTTNSAPTNPLNQARNTVNIGKKSLPPIASRSMEPESFGMQQGNSNEVIYLPELTGVDLNITTQDYSTVNVYHKEHGYETSSFPEGIRMVRMPDIKEVNVRFRNYDGTMCNFVAVPKYNYNA